MRPTILLISIFTTNQIHAQTFTDVTTESGLIHNHINNPTQLREATKLIGGGAVGDYDRDGDLDVYLLGGTNADNAMFNNNGDGTFTDVTGSMGVVLHDILGAGPVFADVDGDADLDLITFSIQRYDDPPMDEVDNRARLLLNNNGVFSDARASSGFDSNMPSFSGTLADMDQDGDLDLFMSHWADFDEGLQLFWQNDGTGTFQDVTSSMWPTGNVNMSNNHTFTPNFTDINNDGWLDILMTGDFGKSKIFRSQGINNNQLTYAASQPPVITDENGMGAAVGDYDNDGDMDWFVTSIWDPDGVAEVNWGVTGNRLYNNDGHGNFTDATISSGVQQGYWGWGACFADFNNDGHLDIFHENGMPGTPEPDFDNDPARLFMSNGDGTFTESSQALGLSHTGQGRGISCLDYDQDGDLDVMIFPNNGPVKVFRNNLTSNNRHVKVHLKDTGANPFAIGSRVTVSSSSGDQIREVTTGNNYMSNNPMEAHFGLASAQLSQIKVKWPDQVTTQFNTSDHNPFFSVGKYCHTAYQVELNEFNNQLAVFLHNTDGSPISSQSVTLEVLSGPNQGTTVQNSTDNNGQATFSLNLSQSGMNRVQYNFSANNQAQHCESFVNFSQDLIFQNGFD